MLMSMYSNERSLLSMLSMLKCKAMRSRVWYEALSAHERMLVGLATRYIKQVRNKQLAIVLARLVVKLSIAVNQMIRVEQHGFARAYAWLKGAIKSGMGMFMSNGDGALVLTVSKSIVEWFAMLESNLMHIWRWH